METGVYGRPFYVQPDYCGVDACLSALGVFAAFQAISAEHIEAMGIGPAAMLKSGKFWVTVHNRIEFCSRAALLEELTLETWPMQCDPDSTKVFRGYALCKGDQLIARGKAQWSIIGKDGTVLPFHDSGFPADYSFPDRKDEMAEPAWFTDDFKDEEFCGSFTVRSTDIDFGKHMNNIAYVRKMLDQFPAASLPFSRLKAVEIHYGHPCLEGEKLCVYQRTEDAKTLLVIRKEDGKSAAFGALEWTE